MRIVTRPDFDGIVCAVLLKDIFPETDEILWMEPYEIDERAGEIREGDIIANLPYASGCSLWFDHHATNEAPVSFKGVHRIAPSAAGVIFDYYRDRFKRDFTELAAAADKIDAADLTLDEVHHPERYPWLKLSLAVSGKTDDDRVLCERIIQLLGKGSVTDALADAEVADQVAVVLNRDREYEKYLLEYTEMRSNFSLTDFRSLDPEPKGSRFLVYSLFPEALVSVRVRYKRGDKSRVVVSLGRNIFKDGSKVHLGDLMAVYGGGGHAGAASCSLPAAYADDDLKEILAVLEKND